MTRQASRCGDDQEPLDDIGIKKKKKNYNTNKQTSSKRRHIEGRKTKRALRGTDFIFRLLAQEAEVELEKFFDHLLLTELKSFDECFLAKLDIQVPHLCRGLKLLHC